MEREPSDLSPVLHNPSTPSPNPSLSGSRGAVCEAQGSQDGSLPGSSRTPQPASPGRQGLPARASILKPSTPVPSPKVVRFNIPSSDPSTPDSSYSARSSPWPS